MKKDGYTWEDLDKAWWEGFDTCKAKAGEANVKLNDELEKLKKQLEMSNKVYNDNLDYSYHIEEQLTKAKELLERLLITSCNSDVLNLLPNCSEVLRVRVEAEQFLKDSDYSRKLKKLKETDKE